MKSEILRALREADLFLYPNPSFWKGKSVALDGCALLHCFGMSDMNYVYNGNTDMIVYRCTEYAKMLKRLGFGKVIFVFDGSRADVKKDTNSLRDAHRTTSRAIHQLLSHCFNSGKICKIHTFSSKFDTITYNYE